MSTWRRVAVETYVGAILIALVYVGGKAAAVIILSAVYIFAVRDANRGE